MAWSPSCSLYFFRWLADGILKIITENCFSGLVIFTDSLHCLLCWGRVLCLNPYFSFFVTWEQTPDSDLLAVRKSGDQRWSSISLPLGTFSSSFVWNMKFCVCGFSKEDTVVQHFRKDVGFCSETATMPCVSACALFLETPYTSSDCKLVLQFRNGFDALQYKLILCHWSCLKWWCLWWHSHDHRAFFIYGH